MEEAFAVLDTTLSQAAREQFRNMPVDKAVTHAHMGLGMYIRNEWFRRGRSSLPTKLHSLGARHIDDMSAMVLTSYWRYLNGKPIELERQGACYKRWWTEQERLIELAKRQGSESHEMPDSHCP
jgi:uncharacterized protein DUF6794